MGEKRVRKVTFIPPLASLSGKKAKRKVAAYARVSTAAEEQESSLIAQRTFYEKHIRENPEWEFVEVYYDDGVSGLSYIKREGFNRMVADALDGKIDLILTKSLSRFARNTVDTLTTIRRLKEKNVEVFFEKENIYTFDGKGEFLITLMSSLAQEESRSMSENITWGKRKYFADGKYSMNYASFLGYKKGTDGLPAIDEDQAYIVKLIYLLYLEGYTSYHMTHYLNSTGIPSPMGNKWHLSTIESILANEKYKGDAHLQKSITVDFLTKKRKLNEGEAPSYYIDDAHPAIVSKEVWALVQEERPKRNEHGYKHYSVVHPLAARIVCEDCGAFYGLYGSRQKGVFYGMFWRCNHFYKKKCQSLCLWEDAADDLCSLAIGDLFEQHRDVIRFCSQLLSSCPGVEPSLATEEYLSEWFIKRLDFYHIDGTTARCLVKEILPTRGSSIRVTMYDETELTYPIKEKGKKLQRAVRELVEKRADK